MTNKKLQKILHYILEEMYAAATPPAQWPSHVVSYEDHYLDIKDQILIVDRLCREHRVSKIDRARIEFTLLDHSPITVPIVSQKKHEQVA